LDYPVTSDGAHDETVGFLTIPPEDILDAAYAQVLNREYAIENAWSDGVVAKVHVQMFYLPDVEGLMVPCHSCVRCLPPSVADMHWFLLVTDGRVSTDSARLLTDDSCPQLARTGMACWFSFSAGRRHKGRQTS